MKVDEILKKLPGLNCGECGFKNCRELAMKIAEGKAKFENCVVLSAGQNLLVYIDNEKIPVGKFVQNIIRKANLGIISNLKGISLKEGDNLRIEIRISGESIDDYLAEQLELEEKAKVYINGEKTEIGRFVQDIVSGVNLGMVSTLKKVKLEPGSSLRIEFKIEKGDLS